jgi:hypothetical protein
VPPRERSWVVAQEHLLFMNTMSWMGERRVAARMALKAIRSRPWDGGIWAEASRALPGRTVYRGLGLGLRAFGKLGRALSHRPAGRTSVMAGPTSAIAPRAAAHPGGGPE